MSETESHGRGTASTGSENACISDIFLHENKRTKNSTRYGLKKSYEKPEFDEKLNIFPNMVEIRLANPPKRWRTPRFAGKKNIITEFSKKSRRDFIKFLCKITDTLNLWLDVSFSDDVMQNKETRKEVSNETINRFRRIILEKYPTIKIVYKREWVPRKSGNLQGEYIPHFHMFISVPDMSVESELLDLASELAKIWVDCTRTKEVQKALSVALHPKSYRLINNRDHAIKYATKYVTKPTENWTNKSIGRSWGKIGGKFNIPEPKVIEMTPAEAAQVKRTLRKLLPKKHPIQKALKQPTAPTFLITKAETVNRIIEHTQQQLEDECLDFFDSCSDKLKKHRSNPSRRCEK